jgi:alcohol dehydrogenase (NADP+)
LSFINSLITGILDHYTMATIVNGKGCLCLAAFDLTSGLKKHEIGRPSPSSNAVAIDIKFCGMCHSDLHATNGDWEINFFPLAPGHEIAGIVFCSWYRRYQIQDW